MLLLLSSSPAQVWPYLSSEQQREVAPLLAAAQWHCQQWESMRRIVNLIEPKSYDGSFFRAVLLVHSNKHEEAQIWIDVARSALHPQFSALGVIITPWLAVGISEFVAVCRGRGVSKEIASAARGDPRGDTRPAPQVLASESYSRAHSSLVRAQQLAELEVTI